jgi:hypothetical protein
MKKLISSLCTLTGMLGLLALSAGGSAGCSSSGGSTGTGGSTGNGGAGGSANGISLAPTSTGFVTGNSAGIIGPWYAYGDSVGAGANTMTTDAANSDCQKKGGFPASACSVINTPMPGQPFPPDATSGAMCTSGTAALVMNGTNGQADYSDLWGAGIALDLNNPGGDAGMKGSWNGTAYTGFSFDFTGTMIPNKAMRVNFPFVGEHGTDSPYYQGGGTAAQAYSTLTNNSHVVIHWADIGGPKYLSDQNITPPPFDKTQIQSIQFQVFTNASTNTPYAFCVNNLTLLTD